MRILAAAALALALLTAACTSVTPAGPAPTLAGTAWALSGVVEGSATSPPAGPVTLEFTADRLSGKACNTFTAGYTLAGDAITVDAIASTRMACAEAGVMAQESLVLEILGGGSTVQLPDGGLVITDPDGRALQFARA